MQITKAQISLCLCAVWYLSRIVTKPTKWVFRPAKTQISLGILPVWSESSLCAQWVAKDPRFLHADSKDSDQIERIPRLIWVFTGHKCHFVGFVTRWLILLTYCFYLDFNLLCNKTTPISIVPRQANLCLRAFRHDKFYLHMPSNWERPGIWLSVWRFLLSHCLYEQAAEVLARLRGCAGSPEPSLLT